MDRVEYLIVGGGLAAASAVDGIRERDPVGSILLLTEEAEPPYHRPPLSKEYLRTQEATRDLLHVKPEGWYEKDGRAAVRTGVKVVSLDPRERTIATADGTRIQGERVLLATGGRPKLLSMPGAERQNVFTLRTVGDAEAIRSAAAAGADDCVLIGAGFIGMELAASFRTMGLRPTVVEVRDRVWPAMLPKGLSRFVLSYFEERGVGFRLGTEVVEASGDVRVRHVVLEEGERLPCDLLVVGVGIEPRVELAREAGMAVNDGIVVDALGETSHAYIYAAGDVARFPDPIFGDTTRVEHWDHAKAHGRAVGRNMAGAEVAYDHLSYFFSDVFDLSLNVFGRPAEADRVVVRGELGAEGTIAFCAAEGRLCGAVAINAAEALEECRELVRRSPPMEELERDLKDPDAELGTLVG